MTILVHPVRQRFRAVAALHVAAAAPQRRMF